MKYTAHLALLIGMWLLHTEGYGQTIIASFESQSDLSKLHPGPGVEISRTTDYAALGAFSCKAVFPETGGALVLSDIEKFQQTNIESSSSDLEESLLWFIWTGEPAEVNIVITDSLERQFSQSYQLTEGANHLQVPSSEAAGVSFKKVKSIEINTAKEQVLYLDYLALDQYQPVVTKLGRWDVEYATDITTPHYNLASELATGPIKSYSISPIFDGRGIIELAQRLELDFQVTTIGRSDGAEKYGYGDFYMRRSPWYGGDSTTYNLAHNYIADDLLFSPEFDVIIWPGLHAWETYPEVVRKAILERVQNGTGLLLLYPISEQANSTLWDISPLKSIAANDAQSKVVDAEIANMPNQLDTTQWTPAEPHFITRGISFEAFPWGSMGVYPYQNNGGKVLVTSKSGNPVVAVKDYGKGRVVAMGYPERGLLPRVDDPWATGRNYPYWEYMWSLVARSVVWASDKEPGTAISAVNRTKEGIRVYLEGVPSNAEVTLQVFDDFGELEEDISRPVSQGHTQINLELSNNLHGGRHIANVQVKSDQGVLDWHAMMFYTDRVAKISAVKNARLEIPMGEKVNTSVTVATEEETAATLTARLYDNYGRLIDQSTRELLIEGSQTVDFALNSENVLTNFGKTEYMLQVDGSQEDHTSVEHFFLQPRIWDDYDVTMYHFGPNPLPGVWPAVDRQLQELNVTTLAAYTLANSKHANYKVQAQTRINGVESPDSGPDLEYYREMKKKYLETKDKMVLKRKYGLKEPEYLNAVREDLSSMVREWKKFAPSAYYIYEEPSVTRYNDALDLCFRESTLNAMRQWLKEEYPSLQKLNEQWGTDFSSWDVVIPDDYMEAQARGNYSSWADHRTFMEICWADQFKFVQEIVEEIDPGGLVQLSGTQSASSHNGYDYSRLNKYVGQMNPYDIDNQLEYHHTFNPDLKVSGQAGYGALGKDVRYDYYHHLFLKETGGSYVFWQASSLNPDLRICQSGADMKAGFDELLKRGIGKLLVAYEPENELNIAIHFSYPSVHASWIVDGEVDPGIQRNLSNTLKQFNRNRDGWVKALHDLGLGFDFVSYSSIENGDLFDKGYQVLILPMSYALSDSEVEQIDRFVKEGGIVIADALPAVMDDHAKFRSQRALAEALGIKARSYTRGELVTPDEELKLKLKRGKALEGTRRAPKMIHNQYGSGSGYLLNYFMDSYPEERLNPENTSLDRISQLFSREQLASSIRLATSSGTPVKGVEKYTFSEGNGTARLLGLLPGKGKSEQAKEIHLLLESPVHLYDIRRGKYLGEGKDFKISIQESVPEFFGLVNGRINDVHITAPSSVSQGEEIKLDIQLAGRDIDGIRSVVHIDVYNPEGERVPYYGDNRDIINGSSSYSFTTALDDASGSWKVKATEVISGTESETLVEVR